jgi:hypothetical protein
MKKGTQSTIQSSKYLSPLRPQRRLQKVNSLRTTESIIVATDESGSMWGKEKADQLNRSIEEQLRKVKRIWQGMRG